MIIYQIVTCGMKKEREFRYRDETRQQIQRTYNVHLNFVSYDRENHMGFLNTYSFNKLAYIIDVKYVMLGCSVWNFLSNNKRFYSIRVYTVFIAEYHDSNIQSRQLYDTDLYPSSCTFMLSFRAISCHHSKFFIASVVPRILVRKYPALFFVVMCAGVLSLT